MNLPKLTGEMCSLRHAHTAFALVKDSIDIRALGRPVSTSVGMIEKLYRHLTPRIKKDVIARNQYQLTRAESEA